ncbi:unnamed protein product [Trichobilharzia szidati]|nr:unnamed protein product [Trichobilharzia szidati]
MLNDDVFKSNFLWKLLLLSSSLYERKMNLLTLTTVYLLLIGVYCAAHRGDFSEFHDLKGPDKHSKYNGYDDVRSRGDKYNSRDNYADSYHGKDHHGGDYKYGNNDDYGHDVPHIRRRKPHKPDNYDHHPDEYGGHGSDYEKYKPNKRYKGDDYFGFGDDGFKSDSDDYSGFGGRKPLDRNSKKNDDDDDDDEDTDNGSGEDKDEDLSNF